MSEIDPPVIPVDYEELLVLAIDLLERGDRGAVERLLLANPSLAARVRFHLSRLHELGFTASATEVEASLPESIGEFRILRRLGSGGMGVVYLARQPSLGRDVALKLVRLDHIHVPGVRERFRREVAAIARLQHPGIVPVYDAGEDNGVPWLAMEPVLGASLDAVVRQLASRDPTSLHGSDLWQALVRALPPGTPTPAEPPLVEPFRATWPMACLFLVRSVALALQHAHERGVLHRDLKPNNIMLTLEGRALLLDFGLAVAAGDARLTHSGSQLGTLAYMPPEQMRGDIDAIDARSDVYALAITAWELLTLQLPFPAGSEATIRESVLSGRLPSLRDRNRAVSREMEIVLRKACDIDPARRYPDAASFAEDLGNLIALRPIRAASPSAWLSIRRWAQRHPARATAIAAGTLLFLVAPTGFLLQAHAANREIRAALDAANDQRRLADTQRDLAREAVDSLLARVANEHLFDVPKMQRVRRDLLDRAKSFYERFLAAAPGDPAQLEQTTRATLQMVFVEGSLGQLEQASATADRAVELAVQLRGVRPGDVAIELLLVDALLSRGRIRIQEIRLEDAEADLAQAARLAEAVLSQSPTEPLAVVHLLGIERGIALVMRSLNRPDDYAAALHRLAELWNRSGEHTRGHDYREVALDHVLSAGFDETRFLMDEGRGAEALAACERATAVAAATADEKLPVSAQLAVASLSVLRAQLGADGERGDDDLAERRMLDCLHRTEAILEDHPELYQALLLRGNMENALGMLISSRSGREAEAAKWFDRSLLTLRAIVAADPSVPANRANLAATLVNVGSQHKDAGNFAKALELFVEAEQLAKECVALAPHSARWQEYQYNATWFVGQTCGDLRDHVGQVDAARRLAELRPTDGKTHRIAAELMVAATIALADDDRIPVSELEPRCDALLREALRRLQAAAECGYDDVARLRNGDRLAPLRDLPGYAAVLERVEANARNSR
ncbi:MAG: protein kinase [Planctomycetota bacterium]